MYTTNAARINSRAAAYYFNRAGQLKTSVIGQGSAEGSVSTTRKREPSRVGAKPCAPVMENKVFGVPASIVAPPRISVDINLPSGLV